MRILAIETSCDDTCIAILDAVSCKGQKFPRFKILSNIVSSQTKIHKKYGGVVPTLAKRAHQENLLPALKKALREAGMSEVKKPKVGIIAVTYGPGLEPALWAGVNFARALSYWWKIPLVGIDHMEGHIVANFLPQKKVGGISNFKLLQPETDPPQAEISKHKFPAICLAVSGGHTQLILVKDILKYKLLGETVDDAAGEAFDKVARMLGLSFPGGPEIAKAAKGGNPKAFDFPRPMLHSKDYNFSFSGLKTAVLYALKKLPGSDPGSLSGVRPQHIRSEIKKDVAASFQQAAVDVLIAKTIKAAKEYKTKTIMLAGGVAANEELRKQLGEKIKKEVPHTTYCIPHTTLATDNAAMIAAAAYFHRKNATLTRWKTLKADGNLKIK